MKRTFLFLFTLFVANFSFAQQKTLTMEDAMLNSKTTLAPETLRQLQFIKGTNEYVYLKKTEGTDTYLKGDFKSKEDVVFLTLAQFNEKLRAASLDTMTSLPPIQFGSDNWTVNIKGQKISFNASTKEYKTIINKNLSKKENVEESSDGYVAYLDSFNLYVTKAGDTKKVTQDGSRDIVYASSVHQNEFGITKGTFWSNNGKMLAFYRMDQSMVPDYPIIDWTERPAKVNNVRYPMAGNPSHHVTLGIYNAVTKTTIWVKTQGRQNNTLPILPGARMINTFISLY
ncbi:MAG: DPP IV N-terminal domain-containing protein [Ferruginibacter sp.]